MGSTGSTEPSDRESNSSRPGSFANIPLKLCIWTFGNSSQIASLNFLQCCYWIASSEPLTGHGINLWCKNDILILLMRWLVLTKTKLPAAWCLWLVFTHFISCFCFHHKWSPGELVLRYVPASHRIIVQYVPCISRNISHCCPVPKMALRFFVTRLVMFGHHGKHDGFHLGWTFTHPHHHHHHHHHHFYHYYPASPEFDFDATFSRFF